MAEGLQIGELPQKENLTGNELIPFQQGSSNGSMSTATLKKYIGTGGGTGGGTDYMNYITEYNVPSSILLRELTGVTSTVWKMPLPKFRRNLGTSG